MKRVVCSTATVAAMLAYGAPVGAVEWLAAAGPQKVEQTDAPPVDVAETVSLDEARKLQEEADAHIAARQTKEALEKTERALAARRQRLGQLHSDVAQSISALGIIAYQQGQYERAASFFAEALEIREAVFGPDNPAVADSLNDLASMSLEGGDFVGPEPLFKRALDILHKASASSRTSAPGGDVQALTAVVLNNLARLYSRRGDYSRAESRYKEVIEIRERISGRDHGAVAAALANLGAVYYTSAQYEKAEKVLQRALAIQPNQATAVSTLASVYFDQGEFQQAEPLFRRALAVDEQILNAQHPRLATRLLNLAETLRHTGQYAAAEPLYERALAIRQRALGPTHPDVAAAIMAQSRLRYATGDIAGAIELLSRGADVREDGLALALTAGSAAEKQLYLSALADETDIAVSLHLGAAPASTAAAQLALTNILRRKGRSVDAMADHLQTVRRHLDDADQEMFNELSQKTSRLARIALRGAATEEERRSRSMLPGEIRQLEQMISARSAEFRTASTKTTLPDVQMALPVRTALIELVSYRPFSVRNPRIAAFGEPHYAAYLLRNDGRIAAVDIGEAAVIDRHVRTFRTVLSSPGRGVLEAGRTLYQKVIAPILPSLSDVDRLIVSADGALNLFPFAALVGQDDKYLVERFAISYVTSGRDLLRLETSGPEAQGRLSAAVIVADPLFGGVPPRSGATPSTTDATRAFDPRELDRSLRFSPLPATALEGAALAKLLPDARLYTGAEASEAQLKQLSAPAILHLATHGFFLRPSAPARMAAATQGSPSSNQNPALDREDALVLSGVALAGANQRSSGNGEDGILTALEVASLDLWGTRMVVLSACETGLGDARSGEGVYGLRRALVLAGAESQLVSLWKVSDTATRDLMVAYYQRLRAGEGRADSLREVQLAMLRNRNRSHPFYWAGFIQSGDWRPMFE
jgi:CHAT domain-containing protein/Tfp pilus assembly protein PilF